MGQKNKYRISYRFQREARTFDVISDRLSTADAYAEICFYEAIPIVAGMPGLTFEEIALEAGVSDMCFSLTPPPGLKP